MTLWTKYAHLADPKHPSRHPLTPAHGVGAYEKGRWARSVDVHIYDCPYDRGSEWYQEWYVGWFDESDSIVCARGVKDEDFVEW